jgi:hypothetical protein
VNARVPEDANTGKVPVKLAFRVDNGLMISPPAYVWVR